MWLKHAWDMINKGPYGINNVPFSKAPIAMTVSDCQDSCRLSTINLPTCRLPRQLQNVKATEDCGKPLQTCFFVCSVRGQSVTPINAQVITILPFLGTFCNFWGVFCPILFGQNLPTKILVTQKKNTFRKSAWLVHGPTFSESCQPALENYEKLFISILSLLYSSVKCLLKQRVGLTNDK